MSRYLNIKENMRIRCPIMYPTDVLPLQIGCCVYTYHTLPCHISVLRYSKNFLLLFYSVRSEILDRAVVPFESFRMLSSITQINRNRNMTIRLYARLPLLAANCITRLHSKGKHGAVLSWESSLALYVWLKGIQAVAGTRTRIQNHGRSVRLESIPLHKSKQNTREPTFEHS